MGRLARLMVFAVKPKLLTMQPVCSLMVCLCLLCVAMQAQTVMPTHRFRVMSYNVENLLDTIDNPNTQDDDFLPSGTMRWNSYKYWAKLRNITRVITAVGEMESPALVGLVEVENDSVLFDLTRRSPLRRQQYEFVCTQSPDLRGINVALLYQRDQFQFLEKAEYELHTQKFKPTRNILHVVGRVVNGDTLDVFVCHFPSRRGGKRASESHRVAVALLLRAKIDSLLSVRTLPNLLIMGDFNDSPRDKSLSQTLGARVVSDAQEGGLANLFFAQSHQKNIGTYKFRDEWDWIDQFIVSTNLLNARNSISIVENSARVFYPPFLREDDEMYGGFKLRRTNLGPRYMGGFSDHFPIVVDFVVKGLK